MSFRRANLSATIFLIFSCVGCGSNRYQENFTPSSFQQTFPAVTATRVINVGHADPLDVFNRDFAEHTLIGTSVWVGNEGMEDNCKSFAKKIGADLVLRRVKPDSRGTYDYLVTVPEETTTYQSGSGNYRGMNNSSSQYGSYNYSGSSTSYGSRTERRTGHIVWHEFNTVYLRTGAAKSKAK